MGDAKGGEEFFSAVFVFTSIGGSKESLEGSEIVVIHDKRWSSSDWMCNGGKWKVEDCGGRMVGAKTRDEGSIRQFLIKRWLVEKVNKEITARKKHVISTWQHATRSSTQEARHQHVAARDS